MKEMEKLNYVLTSPQENPQDLESILKKREQLYKKMEEIENKKHDLQRKLEYVKDSPLATKNIQNKIDELNIEYDKYDKQYYEYGYLMAPFEKATQKEIKEQIKPFVITIPNEIAALSEIKPGISIEQIEKTIQKVIDLSSNLEKYQQTQQNLKNEQDDTAEAYAKHITSKKQKLTQINKYERYLQEISNQSKKNEKILEEIQTTITTLQAIDLTNTHINKLIGKMHKSKEPFYNIIQYYITQKYIIPNLQELRLSEEDAFSNSKLKRYVDNDNNVHISINLTPYEINTERTYSLIENPNQRYQREATEKTKKMLLKEKLGEDYNIWDKINASNLAKHNIDEKIAKNEIIKVLKNIDIKNKREPFHVIFQQEQAIPVKEYPIDQCLNPKDCKLYQKKNSKDFHIHYLTPKTNLPQTQDSSKIHLICTFDHKAEKVNIIYASAIPENCPGTYTPLNPNSSDLQKTFEEKGMVCIVDSLDEFIPYTPKEDTNNKRS